MSNTINFDRQNQTIRDTSPGVSYRFAQPNLFWIVNHNLGYHPQVSVFSEGNVEVDASVIHISLNQIRVDFSVPFSGSVKLT